jgi:site-specific recombinase XerD
MARGLAQGTIAQRLRHFDLLAVRFPDLSIVTTPDLEHVLAQMVMTGKASETRKAMLSTMRVLFRWLYRSGRAVDDPASDLAPIAVHVRQARIASDDDVAAGLITASLPAKVAVLLGRYAGLRLSEISRVHTNDRDGDVLRVLGKGSRERLVPLNSELLEVMMRLETVQGPGPLFPGRWSAHATPSMVSDLIKTATGWNPHSLRHAAATAAYRGTRDMRAVQEFLGHASVQTTQRYVRVGFDDVRAAAAATSLAGVGRTDEALAASAIERAY